MTCDWEPKLHAYHDGELDAAGRAAVESHLATCADCTATLHGLQSLSAVFAGAPQLKLSQISRHRLHNRLDAAMERGLVRFAWSLSGVAAAVLLVGSFWLSHMKDPVQSAPPWVDAVVYAHPLGDSAETPAAQWYLADATTRSDDAP